MTVISLQRIKTFTLSLFLILTVLYYYIRFQFDVNFLTISLQALLLVFLSLFGLMKGIYTYNHDGSKNTFYWMVAFYSTILLLLTFYRGGIEGLLYGFKDFVLPVFILFTYKSFLNKYNKVYFFILIGLLGSFVSLIYILEYFSKFIFLKGYFDYTNGIRALSLSHGIVGFSQTAVESEGGVFYRMPGVLSHTNATGLMIAVSIFSLLPVQNKNYFIKLALVICIVGLIMTGARTAIISFLVGLYFYKIKLKINLYLLFIGLLMAVMVVIFLKSDYPYLELFNVERFYNTLLVILKKLEHLESSNIFSLFIGFGFNYPGMIISEGLFLAPILEDDLFLIQLITMYGLVPLLLFLFYIFHINKNYKYYLIRDKYWLASRAIIICFLFSSFHTNAIIRPQLFPLFFFYIVMLNQILIFYKSDLLQK